MYIPILLCDNLFIWIHTSIVHFHEKDENSSIWPRKRRPREIRTYAKNQYWKSGISIMLFYSGI